MFIVANPPKTLKIAPWQCENLPHPIHFPRENFQEINPGLFYIVFVFALPSYEKLRDNSSKR